MRLREVKKGLSPVVRRERFEYVDRNGNVHTLMIAQRKDNTIFIVAKTPNGSDESLSNFLPQPWPEHAKNSYAASNHVAGKLKRAMLMGGDVHQALQQTTQKEWEKLDY